MKKTLLTLISFAFLLTACSTKQKKKTLSQSELHAKVDSIVGTRMDEINRQAMEDLDHRIAIEVKAKTDSMVNARLHPGENKPTNNSQHPSIPHIK